VTSNFSDRKHQNTKDKMKLESLNQKVGWVVAVAAILLAVNQHIELKQSRESEREAYGRLARATLEIAALKLAAKGGQP